MFSSNTSQVADGGYQIQRSLRCNSADSTNLTRTPSSATNRRTWTWSGWVKRSGLADAYQAIFEVFNGNNDNQTLNINFQGSSFGGVRDAIAIGAYNFNWLVTSAVYRDPSAWYHIVLAVDTTQATANNRIRLYVNGSEVTAFGTRNNPTQNADLAINQSATHYLGSGNARTYFNGYLADINFIDGQQLTPSSFGETNAQTGVWQPKAYSGSYGTNGYYLNFSDNSNTTAATLGKDYSGNGNNWTPNNFSVAAGAGNDSLVDTPTPYGVDTGAGGEVRGNYSTWNPLYGRGTLTNGNLDITCSAAETAHPATMFASSGKWYWEILLVDSNYARVGICNTGGVDQGLGNTANGWCYLNDGRVFNNGVATSYGVSATNNDVINVALDLDAGRIWYGKNGTWMASGNPATGANPSQSFTANQTMAPAVAYGFVGGSDAFTANFGQRPFAYTAPSGFRALCTQNLPTPTIGATTATQAAKYFNTVLYTANGSGGGTVTGVGFQPDFTWFKVRSQAGDPVVCDVLRGANQYLTSNTTNPSQTYSGIWAASSDGWTSSNGSFFANQTYVGWNWKANGAGVTNTAGSITSTVSANTTSGFSIVTYTGTSANATVGHGLGVAPSMIIVKSGSAGSTDWRVFATALNDNSKWLALNTTAAATTESGYWNTGVSSTVFGLGNYSYINASGSTYVAYCFAEVPGFSRFGSYTGNGSTDGPFVFCGFRPAFVLLKSSSSSATDWVILDNRRDPSNVANDILRPNLSDAELTDTYSNTDFLANGFKLRGPGSFGFNISGTTYIFAAFAESPFKYALAR